MMEENLRLVDILIELLDARIPLSSKNPDIDGLAQNKHRITVLNKSDLADPAANEAWRRYFEGLGHQVVCANSVAGKGLDEIVKSAYELMAEKIARQKARGRINVPIRAMIVGIPNVGKSTIINKYAKKQVCKVADRPGVTRGKQWIKIRADFELLDTPGILWPKFDNPDVGRRLAYTGAIRDEVVDLQNLAADLIDDLQTIHPNGIKARYGVDFNDTPEQTLLDIANARGFRTHGGEPDAKRAAIILIDEFRAGLLGRITLEKLIDLEENVNENAD